MFATTPDQQLFEDSARRFLDDHYPVERIRALGEQEATFDPVLWREAAELGWTSLLVPESAGGGSITGNGVLDLLPVAFQFGQYAAPGPLLGTNVVAAALGRWGSSAQREGQLADLVGGQAVAAWALDSTIGANGRVGSRIEAVAAADHCVLNGLARKVESLPETGFLLVTADEATGRSQFLVPVVAAGVSCVPLRGIDLTRRFQDVALHDVRLPVDARVGEPGTGDRHDADLLDLLVTLAAAEIVGTMQRAFDLTLEWTASRFSFGRPLASYQVIKHRMADMRTRLEASEAITARAATDVGEGAASAPAVCSAAMAYVGTHAPELLQDCIQLHGGIGVTQEHDLHIFLRRATVDAHLGGGPRAFAARLGALVVAAEGLSA